MARTRRANRYCVDCGARLVYYPRLSNPKAPNEHRVLVYACPDCTEDFEKPKMFSIKRNVTEDHLETEEIEITQIQKKLAKSKYWKKFLKNMYPEKIRSRAWYLVPIFFGLIGGIIAYFAIRRDDPQKAKKCLWVGIILTAINIIVNI